MICLDQPNRRIRTRMSGGVGGGSREATPYPYTLVRDFVVFRRQWPRSLAG